MLETVSGKRLKVNHPYNEKCIICGTAVLVFIIWFIRTSCFDIMSQIQPQAIIKYDNKAVDIDIIKQNFTKNEFATAFYGEYKNTNKYEI